MSKVPQHLIEELQRRGFVDGAVIKTTYGRTVKVPSPPNYHTDNGGGLYVDGGVHEVYDAQRGKWATVITPAPASEAEGLKENDVCRCGPAMRGGIIETAEAIGLPIHEGVSDGETWPHLSWANGLLSGCREGGYKQSLLNFITPEAFIARMRVTAALPKPIKIGDHKVEFIEDGDIKVGCTTVDFATLEAVYNKAKSKMEQEAQPVKL